MKNIKFYLGLLLLLIGNIAIAQNIENLSLLNIADLNPKIAEYHFADKIEKENVSIKRSRRDAQLLVVTFNLKANRSGELILCRESFATSFKFRSHPKIMTSKAMGVIDNSGKNECLVEEGKQQILVLKNGDQLLLNVVFEVPEETSEFEFHCLQAYGEWFEI